MISVTVRYFLFFCSGVFFHMSVLHFFRFEETATHYMIRNSKSPAIASAIWACVQSGLGLAIILLYRYQFGSNPETMFLFVGFCFWGIMHGLWVTPKKNKICFSAMAVMTSVIGILCGVSGLEHGFFEVLQGNVMPTSHHINAIGEANRFWKYGLEYAYTVIPNFLATGICAMIFSSAVIVTSAFFVRKKHGWIAFMLLSIAQYLTGGGAMQIGLAVILGIAAFGKGTLLRFFRKALPIRARTFFSKLWIPVLILFSLVLCQAMITAIFGIFLCIQDQTAVIAILYSEVFWILGLLLGEIFLAGCYDSLSHPQSSS